MRKEYCLGEGFADKYPDEYRALQRFVSNLDTEKDSLFLRYFELSEIVLLGMKRIVMIEIMMRYGEDIGDMIKSRYGKKVFDDTFSGYSDMNRLDKAMYIEEVILDEGRKLMWETKRVE